MTTTLLEQQTNLNIGFSPRTPGQTPRNKLVLKPGVGPQAGARFELLPTQKPRAGAMGVSVTVQLVILGVLLLIPLIFPQRFVPKVAYDVIPIASPRTEVPRGKAGAGAAEASAGAGGSSQGDTAAATQSLDRAAGDCSQSAAEARGQGGGSEDHDPGAGHAQGGDCCQHASAAEETGGNGRLGEYGKRGSSDIEQARGKSADRRLWRSAGNRRALESELAGEY